MKTTLLQAKSGNPKALFAAFLYFDTGFTVWFLLGALAPFIAEALKLSDSEKGFMVAIPVLAAAMSRISFGYMFQAIEAKNSVYGDYSLIHTAFFIGSFLTLVLRLYCFLAFFLGLRS